MSKYSSVQVEFLEYKMIKEHFAIELYDVNSMIKMLAEKRQTIINQARESQVTFSTVNNFNIDEMISESEMQFLYNQGHCGNSFKRFLPFNQLIRWTILRKEIQEREQQHPQQVNSSIPRELVPQQPLNIQLPNFQDLTNADISNVFSDDESSANRQQDQDIFEESSEFLDVQRQVDLDREMEEHLLSPSIRVTPVTLNDLAPVASRQ